MTHVPRAKELTEISVNLKIYLNQTQYVPCNFEVLGDSNLRGG